MDEREMSQTPPVVMVRTEGSGRTALWVLIGVTMGFILPVASCALLIFVSFVSLAVVGQADDSLTMRSSGIGEAVAIVRVEGTIAHGDEEDYGPGAISGVVIGDLERAAADPTVKAVVLRVDSPGGGVTGSAQIYEEVRTLGKPVVVSMASVAASGGYYVSAPADLIVARPDTITGSIGVVYTLFNAEALLEELGVEVTLITSGPNKAFGSPFEELTQEQRQILEQLIDETYEEFVRVVAEGRELTEAEVEAVADGRIFSGRQALELGLVDELGDLEDAIVMAAKLGGIEGEPRIVDYEHVPGLEDFVSGFASRLRETEAERMMALVHEMTTPALEYRYVGPGATP